MQIVNKPLEFSFNKYLSQSLYSMRGIAIFLIVVGHVIGDTNDGGIRQMYHTDRFFLTGISDFIYTFHRQLFFIISGVAFAAFSNKSRNLIESISARVKRLLIPLICWAPFFFIFQSLSKSQQLSLTGVINAVIFPYSIFWFFHALIFAYLVALICEDFFKSKWFYIGVSITLYIQALFTGFLYIYCYWNIFYAIGIVVKKYLEKFYFNFKSAKSRLIFTLVAGMAAMLIINYFKSQINDNIAMLINGTLSFFMTYALIILINEINLRIKFDNFSETINGGLIFLGKMSMGIYLFHIYFATVTRLALVKIFHINNAGIHLLFGSFISVLGPILIYKIFQKNQLFKYSIGESKSS